MVQLPKGKSKQREPPPVLFAGQGATTGSSPGTGATAGGSAGIGGAPASRNNTASSLVPSVTSPTVSAAQSKLAGAPTLPSLQRTTSRLRNEVAGTSSAAAAAAGGAVTGGVGVPLSTVTTKASVAESRRSAGPSESATNFKLPLPLPLRSETTRATDRSDALWSEMQATLEEIELSASEGTRVFGPDHDRKLAELRQAQIALAQAWARSEADDAIETSLSSHDNDLLNPAAGPGAAGNLTKITTALTSTSGGGAKDDASAAGAGGVGGAVGASGATGGAAGAGGGAGPGEGPASTAGTTSVAGGAAALPKVGGQLEEETQVDILLARKRREANDRYFQRVSQGVLDVVAKLEDVAGSMRAVEQESKDIWSDNDSEQHSIKA